MQNTKSLIFVGFLVFTGVLFTGLTVLANDPTFANNPKRSENTKKSESQRVYFKIDQGYSQARLLDQKKSNLHYTGPGVVLDFGRRKYSSQYLSEWNFVKARFNYLKPRHEATTIYKPSAGLGYRHLRKLDSLGVFECYAGLQATIFADIRLAPALGNSFLFADAIGEIRPQAKLSTSLYALRKWNIDFSLSATLTGYGLRIPEYAPIFRVGDDGGAAIQGFESRFLHPFNFGHITTGLFFRESFGGASNPNWFRIGYIWDYYTMPGNHDLNVYNAAHQFVLELYFRVN